MTSPLGFVVLARRPGQPAEPVSAVFPVYPNGLELAENALEGATTKCRSRYAPRETASCYCCCTLKAGHAGLHECNSACGETWIAEPDLVTFVIGEITERTP